MPIHCFLVLILSFNLYWWIDTFTIALQVLAYTMHAIYTPIHTYTHLYTCISILCTLNFLCYTWINNFDSLSLAFSLSLSLSLSLLFSVYWLLSLFSKMFVLARVCLCDCCKISSLFNGVICSPLKIDLQLGLLTNCSMIVFTSYTINIRLYVCLHVFILTYIFTYIFTRFMFGLKI